jgi:V/A-type H+-transporting ATPase subunit D
MSSPSPTRSAVVELKDERRAMHEGYVFLDEKCLLLAGEILRQLALHARLQREAGAAQQAALVALQAAVARHGLQGLQVYPAADLGDGGLPLQPSSLMGVRLQQGRWPGAAAEAPSAVNASPEAEACRRAFAAVLDSATPLAAVAGNLERLSAEYRRSVRRARALQDVMLPEIDRSLVDIEGRLEELEQEDAVWMRQGAARSNELA